MLSVADVEYHRLRKLVHNGSSLTTVGLQWLDRGFSMGSKTPETSGRHPETKLFNFFVIFYIDLK